MINDIAWITQWYHFLEKYFILATLYFLVVITFGSKYLNLSFFLMYLQNKEFN
jgi:hypothetical protein